MPYLDQIFDLLDNYSYDTQLMLGELLLEED